jgi:hypothetical protein
MGSAASHHPVLEGFTDRCRRWSGKMARINDASGRIDFMCGCISGLLLDSQTVTGILERIAAGDASLKPGQGGLFDHELLLYLDPSRRFSIRVYFHEAGRFTPIHDHSAWGISGTPFGTLGVVRYRRLDDGKDPGRATLTRTRELALTPGELDVVYPLDDGIHQTGSPTDEMNVMISAYGPPLRRLYIRSFDPATGRVTRHFPPRIRLRRLANEAAAQFRAGPVRFHTDSGRKNR